MGRIVVVAGLLLLAALPRFATAGGAGTAAGVQSPAWVQRQGAVAPLAPGMALEEGDVLRTGKGGRLLLRLAEGSDVKLGEGAEFRFGRFRRPSPENKRFRGLLEVLKGAFRFTTTLLSRPHRRDLDIRIATVTAGIRGTDLWGNAAPDKDIVCLIDGRISVTRGDDAPVVMDRPLSFYVAPKDAPPEPVAAVSRSQLDTWAAETELEPGAGIMSPGGRWLVNLFSVRSASAAARALRRLHRAGYPAELLNVEVAGVPRTRAVVRGFSSAFEARSFARRMDRRAEIDGAWILHE